MTAISRASRTSLRSGSWLELIKSATLRSRPALHKGQVARASELTVLTAAVGISRCRCNLTWSSRLPPGARQRRPGGRRTRGVATGSSRVRCGLEPRALTPGAQGVVQSRRPLGSAACPLLQDQGPPFMAVAIGLRGSGKAIRRCPLGLPGSARGSGHSSQQHWDCAWPRLMLGLRELGHARRAAVRGPVRHFRRGGIRAQQTFGAVCASERLMAGAAQASACVTTLSAR